MVEPAKPVAPHDWRIPAVASRSCLPARVGACFASGTLMAWHLQNWHLQK
jgi:hypothetical protein